VDGLGCRRGCLDEGFRSGDIPVTVAGEQQQIPHPPGADPAGVGPAAGHQQPEDDGGAMVLNATPHPPGELGQDGVTDFDVTPFPLGPFVQKVDNDGNLYYVLIFDILLTVFDSNGDKVPIDDFDTYEPNEDKTDFNRIDTPPSKTRVVGDITVYYDPDDVDLPSLPISKIVPAYDYSPSVAIDRLERNSNEINNSEIRYSVDFKALGKDYNVTFTIKFVANGAPSVSSKALNPK
jgi:hypothetical protein